MMGYALTTDPIDTWTHRLKVLLPHTSDPDLLSDDDLAARGIGRYERVRESLEWWQRHGEPVLSDNTITFPAVERELEEVQEIAKRRIDDRRDELQVSLFEWDGNLYQTRPSDRENMQGEALTAFMFITEGGDPDSFYWDPKYPEQPQGWIAVGNGIVPMAAQNMIDFAMSVKQRHKALIMQGRMKKDAVEQAQSVTEVVGVVDAGWG